MKLFFPLLFLLAAIIAAPPATAHTDCYRFGVINQRTVLLTAQHWNPILRYVSEKSGVPLCLSISQTAEETTAMQVHGEFEFILTNRLFGPNRQRLEYDVIARLDNPGGIRGQIVVLENSPIRELAQINGQEVAFPSQEAPLPYWAAMRALHQAGIQVSPVFAGNVEGAMSQLKNGRVAAASVHSGIMAEFARRENLRYRALWSSQAYPDHALLARRAMAQDKAPAVRAAFLAMSQDPAGQAILQRSAELVGATRPIRFIAASNEDYAAYHALYATPLPALSWSR